MKPQFWILFGIQGLECWMEFADYGPFLVNSIARERFHHAKPHLGNSAGECDPMDGGNFGSLFAFFGWAHL